MPIYEYQCEKCNHKLECIQKIDDDPLLTCPKCDSDSLRKLMSASSFRLKGTGWYATDFKDKPKKPPADKETATAKKDDTKPAEKPAAADSSSTGKDTGSTGKDAGSAGKDTGSTGKQDASGST